jgi:hypothetical protein
VIGGFRLGVLAVSMKRWVMPAMCTSWSPKLATSGVGVYPYLSAGSTSATSTISVAAR